MCNYTKEQYDYARKRIDELIHIVPDEPIDASPESMELSIMSEVVMAYETEHFSMAEDLADYDCRMGKAAPPVSTPQL